jgi:hypothetical protein
LLLRDDRRRQSRCGRSAPHHPRRRHTNVLVRHHSQAIFTSPTNGRLTLETGTYIVEGVLILTAMSATSGNALVNLLGAGTATARLGAG